MNPFTETQRSIPTGSRVFAFFVAVVIILLTFSSLSAQTPRKIAAVAGGTEDLPAFQDYRGIQLGMTTAEVRKKLGNPNDKGDEQDFFVFNENETVQIVYDKTHQVTTISADFMSTGASVPTAKQVFGADVEAKPDGSVGKMVRFPKAGYWLSYYRTAGASPLTTVTLQKIQ
jgi:hypothetical protein